ncbi:hypothetical protein ACWCP6_19710 [Streptomyces sp. NPDC002004]
MPFDKGDITAVEALSERQAWAVGYRLTDLKAIEPLALRWDGTTWKQESTLPANSFPQALAVRASDDMWVAGSSTAHWDGTTWTARPLARDPVGRVLPDAVATTSDGTAYVAGRALPLGVKDGVPAIQVWDGSRWQRQTLPDLGKGELNSIAALSTNDVWATGLLFSADESAPQTSLALHWDGISWKRVHSPTVRGTATWLSGVTALDPKDVWAVGGSITGGGDHPFAIHWDGKRWTATRTPNVPDGRLRTVIRTKDGRLMAFGGKGAVSVVLRWDRTARRWRRVQAPGIVLRDASSIPGSSSVWAVGLARTGDLVPTVTQLH